MLVLTVGTAILLPLFAACLCLLFRSGTARKVWVGFASILLLVNTILLAFTGPGTLTIPLIAGISPDFIIALLDFGLLFVLLGYAVAYRSPLLVLLTVLQIGPLFYFEFFVLTEGGSPSRLVADNLALVLAMIIGITGPLICLFALPYMEKHDREHPGGAWRLPKFFFFMLLFLGAMNGLVFSDNLLWFYFFWELTTLCSFMLIRIDKTAEAHASARRALWMNMVGGVLMVFGMYSGYAAADTLSLQVLVNSQTTSVALMLFAALLCTAAFTKSAQVPFQGWLLGAMVAPTPVSALLHSSTMVNAGVYLALRLTPVYNGTPLSTIIAMFGAFTFLVTAALAVGQRNGKRILAYSTISNLGLVFACAGINTPEAVSAGILLIVFHAVSKALLFLCMGRIEQQIGSRDIEDMRGLSVTMPRTVFLVLTGMLALILPPFGALLSKWMAIEAASNNLFVLVCLALGSGFTVLFWIRWAGVLVSAPHMVSRVKERMGYLTSLPLMALAAGVIGLSLSITWLYTWLVRVYVSGIYGADPFTTVSGTFEGSTGGFAVIPIFLFLAGGFGAAVWAARRFSPQFYNSIYASGLQASDPHEVAFKGPMDKWERVQVGNPYLPSVLGEARVNPWINGAALLLLGLLLGRALL